MRPKTNPDPEWAKTLFQAAGAVWGFYGVAQLALLGYVASPKADGAMPPSGLQAPLVTSVGLFFLINLLAIIILQWLAAEFLPPAKNNKWVLAGNIALPIAHFALSLSSLWVIATVYRT